MSYADVYLPGVIQTPSTLQITDITNANPMVCTVSADSITAVNTYREGQLVKLFIPFGYGMQQANGNTYKIVAVEENEISLDVDSTFFDPFSEPVSGLKPASMSPSGSRNLEFSNTTTKIPFESYNNRGN